VNRRELIPFLLILLLAAFLRLAWPGLTEFKQDEAHIYRLALDLVDWRAFPLHGIAYSVGWPSSPLSIYLFALPLLVWKSPLAMTLWVGALNTGAVALVYWVTRRYWGERAALWAMLFYAVAPWAIIFSRKIWSNDLLPVFIAGYLASGLLAFVEARPRWLTAHLVLLVVAAQLHLSAAAYAPVTLILLIVFRARVAWRAVFNAALIAAVLSAPYLIYLASHLSALTPTTNSVNGSGLQFTFDAVSHAAVLAQGTFTHSLAGAEAYQAFRATLPNFDLLFTLLGAVPLWGGVVALKHWQSTARSTAEASLVLLLSGVFPVLFFIPHATPGYLWYLLPLLPPLFMLMGLGWEDLLQRWPRWAVCAPLLIAGAQVWQWGALLNFISLNNTPGAFGTPLVHFLQVAEIAQRSGAEDIVILSDGASPQLHFVPAVFDVLLNDQPHRFVDDRLTAVFPTGNALVVLWPGNALSAELYRGEWGRNVAHVNLRADEGTVWLIAPNGLPPAVPQPRAASALLSNGVEILGSGRDAGHWQLWWQAPEGGGDETYQVFAHLLDANGQRLAQVDQATYPVASWRAGDRVVSYFELSDAGPTVRAGMYAYPSLTPVVVLDGAGNPAGEWLILPR